MREVPPGQEPISGVLRPSLLVDQRAPEALHPLHRGQGCTQDHGEKLIRAR